MFNWKVAAACGLVVLCICVFIALIICMIERSLKGAAVCGVALCVGASIAAGFMAGDEQ